MIHRRLVALAVIFLVGVAGCVPARAEENTRAIRGGKHLSRFVEHVLIVRCARGGQKYQTGQRRNGTRSWSPRTQDSLGPDPVVIRILPVRPVDTLPGHWGALHLTI
jgi:hypothetical protein